MKPSCLLLPASNELVFEAPSFGTSNLIIVPFYLPSLPPPPTKLSRNPYRNQGNVYNLAAGNLGFNKSPVQPSMSTNSL